MTPTAALALVRCLNRVKFLTFMRNLIETFHSERGRRGFTLKSKLKTRCRSKSRDLRFYTPSMARKSLSKDDDKTALCWHVYCLEREFETLRWRGNVSGNLVHQHAFLFLLLFFFSFSFSSSKTQRLKECVFPNIWEKHGHRARQVGKKMWEIAGRRHGPSSQISFFFVYLIWFFCFLYLFFYFFIFLFSFFIFFIVYLIWFFNIRHKCSDTCDLIVIYLSNILLNSYIF